MSDPVFVSIVYMSSPNLVSGAVDSVPQQRPGPNRTPYTSVHAPFLTTCYFALLQHGQPFCSRPASPYLFHSRGTCFHGFHSICSYFAYFLYAIYAISYIFIPIFQLKQYTLCTLILFLCLLLFIYRQYIFRPMCLVLS